MNSPAPPGSTDPSANATLEAFLRQTEEGEARRILGELIAERAQPLVKAIVRRRLGPTQDVEDVCSHVVLRLLTRLEDLKRGGDASAIGTFEGYVATVAAHACDDAIRERRPGRLRIRNRLRYLFTHTPELALWPLPEGRWVCGLAGWQGRPPASIRPTLSVTPALWEADPRELLRRAVRAVGDPIDLDELVSWLAQTIDLGDRVPGRAGQELADPRPSVGTRLVQLQYLERLWAEILALPVRQRAALLLNLRDPQTPDVICVLPMTGVASLRQIAQALEIPAAEFAALWNTLPLEDQTIASRMGLSRQQVINLRKAARARLARRLRAFGEPPA